ncbi:MAG: CDP-glucose 4,6-dehydratase [Candidatus Methanomethylophilaceae archaeon]|nr:CDP-glucose 4,6-dehydratase [Candidatus Methanomethylophilaceae archaeon]
MTLDSFFEGKKALITGHTGFKGSYLSRILQILGADVYGYSLEPPTDPSLYDLLNLKNSMVSEIGDIRDFDHLESFYSSVKPDIIIHMAAQPLVREGYREPKLTYETNVMGTVNLLECSRKHGAKSFLNVTTDKVYYNDGSGKLYREDDYLNGFDPYSNSKSCSDIITQTYAKCFEMGFPISTARAGNVIGGGDFAAERIVPDCARAMIGSGEIILRNPDSVRPYQHVFEPLYAYLTILKRQSEDPSLAGCYNVGPNSDDIVTTKSIVNRFSSYWGKELRVEVISDNSMKEAAVLRLDNTKLKTAMSLSPMWGIDEAIAMTVEWTKIWAHGEDVKGITDAQIMRYLSQRGERTVSSDG